MAQNQEQVDRIKKERTDALYASVRIAAPKLYEKAVVIASITELPLDKAAALERHIMGLLAEALGL